MLKQYDAARYEEILTGGRTQPLVLACRSRSGAQATESKVVKAIGCPDVSSQWQIVTEVVSNVIARRLGVTTPEPCAIHISEEMAAKLTLSAKDQGHVHQITAGWASGCALLRPPPAPYTSGQNLGAAQRVQAARLFVFDMLAQNPDRRMVKPNCGMIKDGIVAFDFEMCFGFLFVPVVGGSAIQPWEVSKVGLSKSHLFRDVTKRDLPDEEEVVLRLQALADDWGADMLAGLPAEWHVEAERIWTSVASVRQNAKVFAKEISRSLM